MFTGIVQGVGRVVDVRESGGTTALRVDVGDLTEGLQTGASVAVNGVCLTAVAQDAGVVCFDIVQETRAETNLGRLRRDDAVNIERSFRVGDEVGGHLLSGHVSTTVSVAQVQAEAGHRLLTLAVPEQWLSYLMPRGFVALNGASLTIQSLDREKRTIAVSLIPETLARTTFADSAVGHSLNLEVDGQTLAVVETVRALLPTLMKESVPTPQMPFRPSHSGAP